MARRDVPAVDYWRDVAVWADGVAARARRGVYRRPYDVETVTELVGSCLVQAETVRDRAVFAGVGELVEATEGAARALRAAAAALSVVVGVVVGPPRGGLPAWSATGG